MKSLAIVLANFGGPRHLSEIEPFLTELLTDRDVLQTGLPHLLHYPLFRYVAKRRAPRVAKDYETIGGGSPIHSDTEKMADYLRDHLPYPVLTFHRYLPETHAAFLEEISNLHKAEIRVFPLFPQFTYATTGSLARWMEETLPSSITPTLKWIPSYATHPAFIAAHQSAIHDFLTEKEIDPADTLLLFSAHGIPQRYVDKGDPYQQECQGSFDAIMKGLPSLKGLLAFQSKFGPGEWLRPYTSEVSQNIAKWAGKKKNVIFVPISFTSDHIETLFEVEDEYLPPIREAGYNAYRVPALTLRPDWLAAIHAIIEEGSTVTTPSLIRKGRSTLSYTAT